MPNPDVSGAAAYNAAVWANTPELGTEWMEQLAENSPVIADSNGPTSQAIATGAQPVGVVVDYLVRELAEQGSPIDVSYPSEGVPYVSQPVGIFSSTDEEAASKAFVDFLVSEEGQKLAVEQSYLPIRRSDSRHPGRRARHGRHRHPLARPRNHPVHAGRGRRDLPFIVPRDRQHPERTSRGPGSPPGPRRGGPADGARWLTAALWAAVAFFVLLPIAAILYLAGDGSQIGVLLDGDVLVAARNSFVSAGVSAVLAVVVGTAHAVLLDRTDIAARGPLRLLALSPLLMPPFVGAIAWLGIMGPTSPVNLFWRDAFGAPLWSIYGEDGVILLLTVHSYPIVMLIVSAAPRAFRATLSRRPG